MFKPQCPLSCIRNSAARHLPHGTVMPSSVRYGLVHFILLSPWDLLPRATSLYTSAASRCAVAGYALTAPADPHSLGASAPFPFFPPAHFFPPLIHFGRLMLPSISLAASPTGPVSTSAPPSICDSIPYCWSDLMPYLRACW